MILYFAPMEGITSCVFRQVHARCFPGVDGYYAPFLAPDGQGRCKASALRELLPENNRDLKLTPQILTNSPEAFVNLSRELAAMGYEEVNLNAGCPSGTVVPKHKGAGMLADPDALDAFLDHVFSRCSVRVSVKTRLGLESTAEFERLLQVYARYPVQLLIVHARDRQGMYRSRPDLDAFARAVERTRLPLCYNGDLVDRASLALIREKVPDLERFMLGRGAAADPSLFRQLRGGASLSSEELENYLARLEEGFLAWGLSEHFTLARLKELWYYLGCLFPGGEKGRKRILKSQNLGDYRAAVQGLFAQGLFDPSAHFPGQLG